MLIVYKYICSSPKTWLKKDKSNIKRSVFCGVVFVVLTYQGAQPCFIMALTTFEWAAIFIEAFFITIQDTGQLLQG